MTSKELCKRLRSRAWEDRQHRELRSKAADEIERLERENAALREAGEHKLDRLLAEIESVLPRPSAETSVDCQTRLVAERLDAEIMGDAVKMAAPLDPNYCPTCVGLGYCRCDPCSNN